MKLVVIKLVVVVLLSLMEPVGNLLHSVQHDHHTHEKLEYRLVTKKQEVLYL